MSSLDITTMEYNSEKDLLIIPEYGRHVQELVKYAITIEDPTYRQAFAEEIIDLIQQMHPQNRNIEDYKEKLWKHLFRIADYKLDVTPPSGEKPLAKDYFKRPEQIPYPNIDTRFRHYGNNVQILIRKALSMEEGPIRDGFITTIASYMKLAYHTWNKDLYVSDEIIKADLETLSGGKLTLVENSSIDKLSNSNRRRRRSDNDRSSRSSNNSRGRRSSGRTNNRR